MKKMMKKVKNIPFTNNFILFSLFVMAGINDKCIGCGTCAVIAPELFKVEGIPAELIKQPTIEDKPKYDEAQAACPVDAIDDF